MRIRKATSADDGPITEELMLPFYRSDQALDPRFNELNEEAIETAGCGYWIEADDKTMFIAQRDGDLAGFVSAVEVVEPPIYVREKRARVDGLYVKEEHRRVGIATHLINHVEQWAAERDCDYVGVSAHVRNEASRSLYEKDFDLKFLDYRMRID